MFEDDSRKKKRIALIGMSTILLVAMVVGVTFSVTKNSVEDPKDNSHVTQSVKAVKTICQPTDYKKECEDSLTSKAGNTTDIRELIKIAFNVTIEKIGEGLKKTELMQQLEKDARTKDALNTCKDLMNLSIEELQRSFERFGRFDLNNIDKILTSIKVWLSGAITYQETCLNGFENTTTDAVRKMKEILQASMHMSSNGLSIINELSKTVTNMTQNKSTGRRLLTNVADMAVIGHDDDDEGDFELPEWVNDHVGARKLLKMTGRKQMANVVVAKDKTGNFTTINEALKHVPKNNLKPFVIYIKEGIYQEYIEVTKKMTHVVFLGDGGKKTRITGNKNFKDGFSTYKTATVAIQGDYFVGIGIGFENTAGPEKHQAVALRVQADKSIFYKCKMDGYQDTLYVHALRQFYRDCVISGTIDFVFGDAVVVLQNCTFVIRKPMANQQCIVTAQGRKERNQPSGIVIQGGSIVADPLYYPVRLTNKAYLARPWKNFSRTIFMDSYIGDMITHDGYMPWQTPEGKATGMDTCFYSEFSNRGPGADKSKRVKWPGIKTLTSQQASSFLPTAFFHGDDWIKVTMVPYLPGGGSPTLPIIPKKKN